MLNPNTDYVPVLKVKRGEKMALLEVHANLKPQITPLLEIVELTSNKTLTQHLGTAFSKLADSVQLFPRVFLDCRELQPDFLQSSEEVFARAAAENLTFVPVTGISRNIEDADAAMNHRHHGLALRLTRQEFEGGRLRQNLMRFLQSHGLAMQEIDLIIDLGPLDTDGLIVPGVAALSRAFMSAVPNHQDWRTFTVSACAFPRSMGGVQRNSHTLEERSDWVAWRDYLHRMRSVLQRLPAYSDCVIQHTAGVEGFDPRYMSASASVRYAQSDDWLLIKGVSTRLRLASDQFPDLATSLVYGHLQQYFYGANHCNGCASIQRCANGIPRHGSPEKWRQFGTIHHITKVAEDLLSLP